MLLQNFLADTLFAVDVAILATFRKIQEHDDDTVDTSFFQVFKKLGEKSQESLLAQFFMIAASRCDENIDFLEYFRDQFRVSVF